MSRLSLLVLFAAVIANVRSEDAKFYIQVLNEVKADIDRLIAPPDRHDYYDNYLQAVYGILDGLNFGDLYEALQEGKHDNQTCQQCNEIFTLGKQLLQSPEIVTTFGKELCKKVHTSEVTERVCDGLLERLAAPIVYILQNTKLDSGEVCAMLLHPDCMTHLGRPMTDNIMWELPIPPQTSPFKPLAGDGKPIKALHMSDLHFDLFYTEGANAACDEPLCCRSTSNGHNTSAGPWGDQQGNCDTPPHSGLKYITQIAKSHGDVDLLLWTGDSIAHDVWNTSREVNLKTVKMISEHIKEEFKNSRAVIVPALGNHEAHPINLYVPSDVPASAKQSMSWLYDAVADDYWSQWLAEPQKKTFKVGGYYSKLVKPNLKAIVLNTNACDRESYWIAYNSKDMDGQLKWLIDELHDSETKGVYTFMIGHVPPSECYLSWFNNYMRIVERFEHLIVGNYFGHTHKEEFFVYENKNETSGQTYPVTHLYIAGSITTYTALNPAYKIYDLDHTGRAQDYTTYYTDVSADNKKGLNSEPVWQTLYSAKSEYGLNDMSAKSWDQLITRAETDDTLTEKFYRNYHRNSPAYVRMNPGDNIEEKRKNLLSKRILNGIYTMLPPIKHN